MCNGYFPPVTWIPKEKLNRTRYDDYNQGFFGGGAFDICLHGSTSSFLEFYSCFFPAIVTKLLAFE